MQIFTKLSNKFKYSKSRKLQASAQTRLTAKTIYAVPGNSVIIDASLADKLTLYWGELSHCATRTPGSVTAIAIVPTSLHRYIEPPGSKMSKGTSPVQTNPPPVWMKEISMPSSL